MQEIDTSKPDQLEQEGDQIQSLCESGQRDEAQKQAIAYAKKMMSRPELAQIRKCGEILSDVILNMPFDNMEEKLKNSHVCDKI